MGCGTSAQVKLAPQAAESEISRTDSGLSNGSASALSLAQHLTAHQRLRKLRELDETTKVPFILVELRGLGHQCGYIEVCGKDEYGVYRALHNFLTETWKCKQLDAGDLDESTPVPFCDALYEWNGFKSQGREGLNNMGLATMRLVEFMTHQLCWTLGVINGGNVGARGEIREQQIIFKAPHPMNMVAPHVMVELRSVGYIEVSGEASGILQDVESVLAKSFGAVRVEGREDYCDRYYRCNQQAFQKNGTDGDNNLGLLTTRVCDAVVKLPGWSLVTMNGGNYGDNGTHREQQLVFRWDNHPLQDQPHLLVELRDAGFVEINGKNIDGIYEKLDHYLRSQWRCARVPASLCDQKYTWKSKDMMVATAEITGFFHKEGWQMQVCSQGTVAVAGSHESREQQILFRPGSSSVGITEPHLFIELYTGEGDEQLLANYAVTQVPGNQHIRMCPVGDCSQAVTALHSFILEYMGGSRSQKRYDCDVFMSRGRTDNNLGCWTMRVCDFMVDRLGWSFVVCNVCNLGTYGNNREQQLVFRYDGERRKLPTNKEGSIDNVVVTKDSFAATPLPFYWKIPKVLSFEVSRGIVPCEPEEMAALQELVDVTFRRILTRDREFEYQANTCEEMPFRLVLVHAFRSENLQLYQSFAERRQEYQGGTILRPRTTQAGCLLNQRLGQGEGLLFHGSNPSSGIGILKNGFALRSAGKSTGTMFGNGVYLAECASKADEYASDDSGGTFPQLNALLVCRALIGQPYVVQDPGDHVADAKTAGCDCILGDREAKVGTYREFVFFDERQVLPEYVIVYRREYDAQSVPADMRRATSGSTLKNWQVKMDNGWVCIPPDANHHVLAAQDAGQTQFNLKIGKHVYIFDLNAKTQTNSQTGTVRTIRPPMVKSSLRRSTSTTSTASSIYSPGGISGSTTLSDFSISSTTSEASRKSVKCVRPSD